MSTKLAALLLQEQVILAVRHFFSDSQFHEVFPAVLHPTVPLEPTLYPFQTQWQADAFSQSAYLSTSPEKDLKAALAAGLTPCFAIGSSFRNLEQAGMQHQPEFLMLEWYRSQSSSAVIMTDVQQLFLTVKHALDRWRGQPENDSLTYQGQVIDLSQWQTVSLATSFQQKFQLELSKIMTDSAMQKFAASLGYETDNSTWEQLFNQCFLNELEPSLSNQPTFLTDFPARTSPLCAIQPDRPYLADRFEIYVAGMELGNGNAESTDAVKIRQTFQEVTEERQALKLAVQPIDEAFLADVSQLAGKNCAGIGVGVQRLMMLLADTDNMTTVVPFPFVAS